MYKFKPTLRHLLAGAAIVLGSAACSQKAALTVELKSDKGIILTATRPGSVDIGKWYGSMMNSFSTLHSSLSDKNGPNPGQDPDYHPCIRENGRATTPSGMKVAAYKKSFSRGISSGRIGLITGARTRNSASETPENLVLF